MTRISGVLLDLSGVVFDGDAIIDGAVESIADLRASGRPVGFVTNTTSQPLRVLRDKLHGFGIEVSDGELFTPATAVRRLVETRGLTPHRLVHPDLLEDFGAVPPGMPNAVVVGDAGRGFTFDALNEAFRLIEGGAAFIALARNRTFRGGDGRMCLDAGPFVAALEYATRREAELIGKPSASFYEAARAALGTPVETTVMVGDDVESDVQGALAAGMQGVLVRTGKYAPGDEDSIDPPPTTTLADLRAVADWILQSA